MYSLATLEPTGIWCDGTTIHLCIDGLNVPEIKGAQLLAWCAQEVRKRPDFTALLPTELPNN